jgi:hypothetical protein
MSILTRIRDAFTSEPRVFPMLNTRSAALTWPTYSVGKPQWLPTDPATLALEGYDKVVVAFACVNVIAESVSSAVLRVMENVGTGDANPIPPAAASSPGRLAMLVNNPNPYESQPEFLEQIMKIAAVTGVCVYEKVRGPLDQVVALYPFRTDWLKPIPRNNASYDWEYTVPGVPLQQLTAHGADGHASPDGGDEARLHRKPDDQLHAGLLPERRRSVLDRRLA